MPTYAPYAAAVTPTPAANHLALAWRYDFRFMPRPSHFEMSVSRAAAESACFAIPGSGCCSASRRSQVQYTGDNLIAEPLVSLTHAITIDRPARNVWPWLSQMGAGSRAGWYSYDVLDNS